MTNFRAGPYPRHVPPVQVVQIVIVSVAALVGLPAAIRAYSERSRLEAHAKTALEILEKVVPETAGWRQIKNNADNAVWQYAFILQYPKTLRRRVPPAIFISSITCGAVAAALLFTSADRRLVWGLVISQLMLAYISIFSGQNTAKADRLIAGLFRYLEAPVGLEYPKAKFFSRQHVPMTGDVLQVAIEVRDREADRSNDRRFLSTVEACNIARPLAEEKIKALSGAIRRMRYKQLPRRKIYGSYLSLKVLILTLHMTTKVIHNLKRKLRKAAPEERAEIERRLTNLRKLRRQTKLKRPFRQDVFALTSTLNAFGREPSGEAKPTSGHSEILKPGGPS